MQSTTNVRIEVIRLQDGSVHNHESHPLYTDEYQPIGDLAGTQAERLAAKPFEVTDVKDRLQACLQEYFQDLRSTCTAEDSPNVENLYDQITGEVEYAGGITLRNLDGTEDFYHFAEPK